MRSAGFGSGVSPVGVVMCDLTATGQRKAAGLRGSPGCGGSRGRAAGWGTWSVPWDGGWNSVEQPVFQGRAIRGDCASIVGGARVSAVVRRLLGERA